MSLIICQRVAFASRFHRLPKCFIRQFAVATSSSDALNNKLNFNVGTIGHVDHGCCL